VVTWRGREKGGPHPLSAEELLESGRQDCREIIRHWDDYGRVPTGTCIEIGCGPGRMTSALLDYFDRVFAVDVSPDQLEMARRLLGPAVSRVDLRLVDEPRLDVADGSCAGMLSTKVFQHLSEYDAIVRYLRETWRALAPGSSICVHIPVPGADRGDIDPWPLRTRKSIQNRISRALGYRRLMEYNRYPASHVVSTLKEIGYTDIELRIFPLGRAELRDSFFLARKR